MRRFERTYPRSAGPRLRPGPGAVLAALSLLLRLAGTPTQAQQAPEEPDAASGTLVDTAVLADTTLGEGQLRLAIERNPGDASLHARLAGIILEAGRHAEAHAGYSEAVRLDPRRADYRYGLARAALALGQFAEAESQFAWGAQLDPADPAMQVGLGEASLAGGRPELAAPHFRRAIELADSAPTIRAQAQTLLQQASRESSDLSGQGWPGLVRRALMYAAMATMSLAGLALAVPVAEGLLLMLVMVPVERLRGRR